MDEQIFSVITAIITIATVVLSIRNAIDAKFSELKRELHDFSVEQSVDSAVWKEKIEHLEYRVHANTELINHRTRRYEEGMRNLDDITQERLKRLEMVIDESRSIMLNALNRQEMTINDIQRFLAERQGFNIRHYGHRDD